MRRMALCLWVLTGWACGPGGETPEPPVDSVASQARTELVMPDVPVGSPGHVAITSVSSLQEYSFDGRWPAKAGVCSAPAVVQVIALAEGFGLALLLARPDSGHADTLEIARETRGAPVGAGARLAVQIYPADQSYVLLGVGGTVHLDMSSGTSLTGRITATSVERDRGDTVLIAAAAQELVLDSLPPEQCEFLEETRRSGPVRKPASPVGAAR